MAVPCTTHNVFLKPSTKLCLLTDPVKGIPGVLFTDVLTGPVVALAPVSDNGIAADLLSAPALSGRPMPSAANTAPPPAGPSLVDGKDSLIGMINGHGHVLSLDALPIAAPAQAVLAPRTLDEDPAHCLGCRSNEVGAIRESGLFIPH